MKMKDSQDKINNPAERLHELVSKAKRHPEPAQPAHLWANVFDISVGSNAINSDELEAVVERLRQFRTLIDNTEKGLREFQDVDPRYHEPFDPIRKVVFTSLMGLTNNLNGLLNPVTERHMTLLELAGGEWSRRMPEPKIDDKQLQEILKQAQELLEAVKNASDIGEDLRKVILSMIASIEQAIQEYRIIGPAALEKGIVQVLGQLHWNRHILEKTPEGSKGGKLLKRVGAIGTALIAVMTFAGTTRKTIETLAPDVLFLTSGLPEIPPVDLGGTESDAQEASKRTMRVIRDSINYSR